MTLQELDIMVAKVNKAHWDEIRCGRSTYKSWAKKSKGPLIIYCGDLRAEALKLS